MLLKMRYCKSRQPLGVILHNYATGGWCFMIICLSLAMISLFREGSPLIKIPKVFDNDKLAPFITVYYIGTMALVILNPFLLIKFIAKYDKFYLHSILSGVYSSIILVKSVIGLIIFVREEETISYIIYELLMIGLCVATGIVSLHRDRNNSAKMGVRIFSLSTAPILYLTFKSLNIDSGVNWSSFLIPIIFNELCLFPYNRVTDCTEFIKESEDDISIELSTENET